MTIKELRSRLQDTRGSDTEFTARCPAHDDRNASLSVGYGAKGILLHCFAGCSIEQICEALCITKRDLFHEDEKCDAAPKQARAKKRWPVKEPFEVGKTWRNRRKDNREEPITAVYDYQDADGQVVMRVARTEVYADGHKDKSFPVHSLDAKDGKWYWDKGERGGLLYRLPELLADKAAGRPVFAVEGEKDVDNMRALGFAATCNPGGGGKTEPKGKWTAEHTAWMAGAGAVYLIPDNDEPGAGLMRYIASQLQGKVGSVRLIDLKAAHPELPPKGDVTDYFKAFNGKNAARDALTRLMEAAAEVEREAAEQDGALPTAYVADSDTYLGVPGYCIRDGCLCKATKDGGARTLAPFVAVPREVVVRDDGVSAEKYFALDGWGRGGEPLDPVQISTKEFGSMQWLMREWEFCGALEPANNVEKEVRKAISEAGRLHAKRRTIYTHIGWRRIGGKWAYLYNGGAIGAKNVSVELEGAMRCYSLDVPEEMPLLAAAGIELALLQTYPARIMFPLMGACYLAPLFSALEAAKRRPSFVLFLEGTSGSFKSSLAALLMAHFGGFTNRELPANFHGTPNSIRIKAFVAKDALFLIDDYHPTNDQRLQQRMTGVAQEMLRAVGDGADRSRLTNRRLLDEEKPPRGIVMMTGEQLPEVSVSDLYRLFVINMQPGDVPLDKQLTVFQEQAEAGAFRLVMRGYIEWLAEHLDELGEPLRVRYKALREEAGEALRGKQGRMVEATAHLTLGCEMMLGYYRDIGLINRDQEALLMRQARDAIAANVTRQTESAKQESPTRQFVSMLCELLASRRCGVVDLDALMQQPSPQNIIGYRDKTHYYLLPGVAYGAAQQALKDQGGGLALKKTRMLKQLAEEGLIEPGNDGVSSRPKRLMGKNERVLFMPRWVLEGESAPPEQLGFEPLDPGEESEMPF